MKKILSFLIAWMMLTTTVFANTADEFAAALTKTAAVTSLSGQMTLSATLNEPLEILDTVPVDEYTSFEIRSLVEGLVDATVTADYAYAASEDYKKIDMSMSLMLDTPIVLGEEFKLEAWTRIGIWMQYDMTDEANPVYKMIFKIPFEKMYQVVDLSAYFKANPELIPSLDQVQMAKNQEKMQKALLRHGELKKDGATYTLSISGESLEAYLIEIIELNKEQMMAQDTVGYQDYREAEDLYDEVIQVIKDVELFGEKGMVLTYATNKEGFIEAQVEELHICLNVYDILENYGMSTQGLTREQAVVDFSLRSDISTKDHNQTMVTFPALNEENSEEFYRYSNVAAMRPLAAKEAPVFMHNMVYYPVESMAEQGGRELQVTQEGQVIYFTYPDGTKICADGLALSYDGEEPIETEVPYIIMVDGKAYCVEELLYPLGVGFVSTTLDTDENVFRISYYFEEEEEIIEELPEEIYVEEEPEDDYVPRNLSFSFNLNRALYYEDNVAYIPVYEFVQSLFAGEFTFANHGLTCTATEDNVFQIQTLSARRGDGYVTINGEQRALETEVKEIEGVLNIPISFAGELGLQGSVQTTAYIRDGYVRSWCTFSLPNPDFVESKHGYVSPWLYLNFYSDQVPHMEHDELYVPIYNMLQGMQGGEYTYPENGLEYTAKEENDYGIQTVSAYVGDKFVTVNGEKIAFENPIISVNDIIRVPLSFAEEFGLQMQYIQARDSGTDFTFLMDNPNYKASEEDDIYDNWFYQMF